MTVVTPLFKPATKAGRYARVLIPGAYGTGRTVTALRMAKGFGGRVGLVDTNGGAADLYADRFDFTMLRMDRFNPADLVRVLYDAADEGIETMIIDGASPFWSGLDGIMEQVDTVQKGNGPRSDKSLAWSAVTPLYRDMLTAIAEFPGPVIVTVAQKLDANGVMRMDQREGFEAGFGLVLRLNEQGGQAAQIMKTSMPGRTNEILHEPGENLAVDVWVHLAANSTTEPLHQIQVRDWAMDPARTVAEIKGRLAEIEAARQDTVKVLVEGRVAELGDVLQRCQTLAWANETAKWAVEPTRTRDELRDRLREFQSRGAMGVMVGAGDGRQSIGDLLTQCGTALKNAEESVDLAATEQELEPAA